MQFFLPWAMRKNKAVVEVAETSVQGLGLFLAEHREVGCRSEPDFMALGEALQSVHGDAAEMSRQAMAAIGLLGGKENGVMADLRRLSEDSPRELGNRRREIAGSLAAMETILARLDTLAAQSETLNKLGLYLGVVGLNIGVESTRSPDIVEMFSGVAQEVRQLSVKIRRVAEETADDCQKERQTQQEIAARIGGSLVVLADLSLEAERALREAVDCMEAIMSRSLAAMAEVNEHTRAIADQVGKIVMGIQLHDSMSQRVAHVVEALTTVRDTLEEAKKRGTAEECRKRLASSRQIIVLQCGQITWIIDELEEAHRGSQLAFRDIDQQVEAMGRCFTALQDSGGRKGAAGQTDSLSLLEAALERLTHLLAQGAAMIDQLDQSAGQTASMAERLVKHMRSIEMIRFEIHLKALNTIVMAARLGGHGQSMEVLAKETKFLSDQAHGFVDGVSSVHAAIIDSVQQLRREDGNRNQAKARGELLADSTRTIGETLDRFHREARSTCEQAEILRNAITRANGSLQFLAQLAADLRDHHRQLQGIAEDIAPWVAQIASPGLDEESARLQSLYTMDRERKLHAAVISPDGAGPRADAISRPAETGEDDVLFFPANAAAEATDTGKEDDNVEFF